MHSFLDYIMGGCQIQFTVSCLFVLTQGARLGGQRWVWGTRTHSLLRPWAGFAQVSLLKYHTVTCLCNEFTLLFSPWLFFQHPIRKCMPFNLGGFGEPVYYAFHSFSNCRRQEAVGGLPDSITGWKGLGAEWTVLTHPTEPWLTSWLCSRRQNKSLRVKPNGQCQE